MAPTIDNGCRFDHHFFTMGERFVKNTSSCRILLITLLLYGIKKKQRNRPRPIPLEGRPCIRLERFIEPMLLEGETAHHCGDVCC